MIEQRLKNIEENQAKILELLEGAKPQDYSKKQFGELIDKSNSWIDSKRREGKLKWFLRGGEVRIPATELERLQYRVTAA